MKTTTNKSGEQPHKLDLEESQKKLNFEKTFAAAFIVLLEAMKFKITKDAGADLGMLPLWSASFASIFSSINLATFFILYENAQKDDAQSKENAHKLFAAAVGIILLHYTIITYQLTALVSEKYKNTSMENSDVAILVFIVIFHMLLALGADYTGRKQKELTNKKRYPKRKQ